MRLPATDEMGFREHDSDGQRLEGKVFVLFGSAALIILITAAGSMLFTRYLYRRLGRLAGADGRRFILQVRDHGAGVPEPTLARLFDRFYQADPARGESAHGGVGLTLVRAIARFHGGDAYARNGMPGLVVVVSLPKAGGDEPVDQRLSDGEGA
ncbi:MAG TPA: ATP-binding protein [Denitromonas sp.]|nr:ATP-binding protein [Zoogloeaceae bacterium]HPR05506.1 ATP-binding protein [Denitromonas sp.]HQU88281.1 ATP-binding protein [Denitromonas sp.]HQV14457.1 ATP-binding protein [Denitromonas sp.]